MTLELSLIELETSTFEEMISAGKLKILASDTIKAELKRYYSTISATLKVEEINFFHWKQFYAPFINKYLNSQLVAKNWNQEVGFVIVDQASSPFWSLSKDDPLKRQFINELTQLYGGCFWSKNAQSLLQKDAEKLMRMISDYLEK